MPEQRPAAVKQVIALALMVSALVLGVLAFLIYGGTVPLPEETRGIAAIAVGVAAAADFGIGLWFFRMGQSS